MALELGRGKETPEIEKDGPYRRASRHHKRAHWKGAIAAVELLTDKADERFIRRLQFVANSLRRREEPSVADDLEAVIRLKHSSSKEREEALWRDPSHLTLIKRLEKRTQQAYYENQSSLAKDLDAAVELVRKLRALG